MPAFTGEFSADFDVQVGPTPAVRVACRPPQNVRRQSGRVVRTGPRVAAPIPVVPVNRLRVVRPPQNVRRQSGRVLRVAPPKPVRLAVAAAAAGLYRAYDDALNRYELHQGDGADPDLTGSPFETFTTLPHTTAAVDPDTDHRFVLRRRNRFDLVSLNVPAIPIDLSVGEQLPDRPSAPFDVALAPAAGGTVRVTARYAYNADGAARADTWLIFLTTDGNDPDVGTTTPVEVTIRRADGIAKLSYTTAAQANGTVVKAIVRVAREGTESANVDVYSATAETGGPLAPAAGGAFFGDTAEQHQ